jgi:hypothetical protein
MAQKDRETIPQEETHRRMLQRSDGRFPHRLYDGT